VVPVAFKADRRGLRRHVFASETGAQTWRADKASRRARGRHRPQRNASRHDSPLDVCAAAAYTGYVARPWHSSSRGGPLESFARDRVTGPRVGPSPPATKRNLDVLKSHGQLSHDELSLQTQDAVTKHLEPSIPARVDPGPASVVRPVHLDHQPRCRRQKIHDVLPNHHLPAERDPQAAPGELRPKPRFGERGRAHDTSAFLEECRASRVLRMRRHVGLLGAAKWPGAAPWSAGSVTGAGRGTCAEPAPGAERARRAKPGHFAAPRAMPFAFKVGPPHRREKASLRLRIRDAGPTWRRSNTCPTEQTLPPRASLPQLRAARAIRGTPRSAGAGEHNFGGDRAPAGNVAPGRQPTSRSGRGRASARAEHRRTARGASSEYNRDGGRRRISYPNALVATPSVAFAYDQDYPRVVRQAGAKRG
jgi:hypothetical protein